MSIHDFINGSYEALAGIFVFNHCRVVLKDKSVRGVSILSTMFFATWGIWNLYYYPHLNQWASFFGGLSVVTANFTWITLMLKYRSK